MLLHSLLDRILVVNLVFGAAVFTLFSRTYLIPWIARIGAEKALLPLLLLHGMRHLGLMFLAPGVALRGLPTGFSVPAALGDLLTAMLAMLAFVQMRSGGANRWTFVWLFNIVGTLDLIEAIANASRLDAAPFMSAAYWIPALWVPALLSTHVVIFTVLAARLRRAPAPSRTKSVSS